MDVTSYLLGKQAGGGGGQPTLQEKEITITENGTTSVVADTGYDGLSEVEITTNVSGKASPEYVSFYHYQGTTLDLSWLDTSNITDMSNMFYSCNKLTTLIDVSNFNTSNVTNMENMFRRGDVMFSNLDVSNWNVSKVTTTTYMFDNTVFNQWSTIDFSNWNLASVTDMSYMFQNSLAQSSDKTLNSILKMCTTAVNLNTNNKKLSYLGINSSVANRATTLSNYQEFLDAGWTTGY